MNKYLTIAIVSALTVAIINRVPGGRDILAG